MYAENVRFAVRGHISGNILNIFLKRVNNKKALVLQGPFLSPFKRRSYYAFF
jgi:hypothetical protein